MSGALQMLHSPLTWTPKWISAPPTPICIQSEEEVCRFIRQSAEPRVATTTDPRCNPTHSSTPSCTNSDFTLDITSSITAW